MEKIKNLLFNHSPPSMIILKPDINDIMVSNQLKYFESLLLLTQTSVFLCDTRTSSIHLSYRSVMIFQNPSAYYFVYAFVYLFQQTLCQLLRAGVVYRILTAFPDYNSSYVKFIDCINFSLQ